MNYTDIIGIDNIFQAWLEFRKGKGKRVDVQVFEKNLEDNLFSLNENLKKKSYRHRGYQSFFVHDPKKRHIHKACVRDRVIHHLLYKYLYGLFDKSFIYDCYSCRLEKGTHKAVKRLEGFARIVSKNYTLPCWVLKLDIKKFFASLDHQILLGLLKKRVKDNNILWLLVEVINSFPNGIPLGNLTSQIFANIYMNELDQFIKCELKIKYYIRYADDFIIILDQRYYDKLVYHSKLINLIRLFLRDNLKLKLHPKKIILRKLRYGIDFLGYITLPRYILPRTKTKRRMFKKIKQKRGSNNFNQSLQSYLGYLSHANAYKAAEDLRNTVYLND